jgi:hypothetical protein
MLSSPQLVAALGSASLSLAAMLVLGVCKGVLQRQNLRLCPSCGRYVKRGSQCRCFS